MRATTSFPEGSAVTAYTVVHENVRCGFDLQLIRMGRDPVWTPEATTTPELRKGVAFFLRNADIQDGDRLVWVKGGAGVFNVQRGIDEIKRPGETHHLELWVEEVAKQIARGL